MQARFEGDPAAYIASRGADKEALQIQLRNKVKKCATCGKPNAFTLATCNGCSSELNVEISYTNNVFTSFVLGIAKGPFPFTISMRKQTPEFIVLDDLLSLTQVHLNVLPATHYIPNWMTLLQDPKRGVALIREMYEQAWTAVVEQFWPHHDKLFADVASVEALRKHVIAGFNYPPSQYQLHLQFMLPPFLPFQWLACKKGVHFTKDRFMPFEYVEAVLTCPTHFDWKEDSSVEQLFEFYRAQHGIDYNKYHAEAVSRYYASHEQLAHWNPAHFAGVIADSSFIPFVNGKLAEDQPVAVEKVDNEANADKRMLQNYGRPYNAETGKPTGTYYKYARESLNFF